LKWGSKVKIGERERECVEL